MHGGWKRRVVLAWVLWAVAGIVAASGFAASDELVDLAVANRKPVIADFGLGRCLQCRKQSETLERVRATHGDRVLIRMVNVSREHSLTDRYGVEWIPTLVFFDAGGKVVRKQVGPMDYDAIREQLSRMGVK